MPLTPFSLETNGFTLRGICHHPEAVSAPYVIGAHGMMSTKDSPKYVSLGEKLTGKGFGFVRFDFTGCGESDGNFGDATLTRRIDDLTAVMEWVRGLDTFNGTLGLFGSSMGGTVALAAGTLKGADAMVLLATPVKRAARPVPELKEVYDRYPHYFEDFRTHLDAFPFSDAHHCLIIHGSKDAVVDPENAFFIYERVSPPKEIWIVDGADHPFQDESLRTAMLDMTVRWFARFLPRL